jgi:hypothetical protein
VKVDKINVDNVPSVPWFFASFVIAAILTGVVALGSYFTRAGASMFLGLGTIAQEKVFDATRPEVQGLDAGDQRASVYD